MKFIDKEQEMGRFVRIGMENDILRRFWKIGGVLYGSDGKYAVALAGDITTNDYRLTPLKPNSASLRLCLSALKTTPLSNSSLQLPTND